MNESLVESPNAIESALNDGLQELRRSDASIAEIADEFMSYKVQSVEDTEGYELCKSARSRVVTLRTSIEKKRQELKKPTLEFGRAVDAEAKRLTALIEPIESHLRSQESIVDDERKRIKAEKERREKAELDARVAAFAECGMSMPIEQLRMMPQWEFDAKLSSAKVEKAERDRIDAERAELLKVENERLEREKSELEKLRQEQEAERAELDRQRKELDEQRAAKERAEQAERDRIAAEERREKLKPDREKMQSIVDEMMKLIDKLPEFSREYSTEIIKRACENLMANFD